MTIFSFLQAKPSKNKHFSWWQRHRNEVHNTILPDNACFTRDLYLILPKEILFFNQSVLETMDDLFVFRKFMFDEDPVFLDHCREAAIEKLQTLFPGKRITQYDSLTLGIESDSLYSETGIDIYELGLVDYELPAFKNTTNEEVTTFRV